MPHGHRPHGATERPEGTPAVAAGYLDGPGASAAPGARELLLAFFERVAQRDPQLLRELRRETRFRLEPGRWCFGLPDLHAFFRRRYSVFHGMDYRRFRALIFASPVNRAIRAHGAEIVIADNRGKVDRSRYALRWHAGGPGR